MLSSFRDSRNGDDRARTRRQSNDRADLLRAFREADERKTDALDANDLHVAHVSLFGYEPSSDEIERWMNGRATVDFEAFALTLGPRYAARHREGDARQVFLAMDATCRGFLVVDDLRKAFRAFAPRLASKDVEWMFGEVDGDGDGRVSYRDFLLMIQGSR